MTCDLARDALLEADLPVSDDDLPELGVHLRQCAECARLATALTRDTLALADAVRARKRQRAAIVAVASALAAAAIAVAVTRLDRVAPTPPPGEVNADRRGIVSVEVPRGKSAMVLQTKDPNVTIVWLTNARERGS